MMRDYAKRSAPRKRTPKKTSYLGLWFFVLLLFVVLTFGLVYLGKQKQYLHSVSSSSQKVVVTPKQEVVTKKAIAPKFDFYTIQPLTKNKNSLAEYELAVAVAKDYAAADHLKAELALLGFTADIIPIRVKGSQKYQVNVGPYDNKGVAMADLEKLKQNKISGKLKKVR
ncbi:MAG: hypothetical protein ACD_21C00283G0002 [uncultured bacterium]|nr:MAG: hypothetical protein ACD_21C00283G0002 [uncultured bacterium]